jgi:hypothetical protein
VSELSPTGWSGVREQVLREYLSVTQVLHPDDLTDYRVVAYDRRAIGDDGMPLSYAPLTYFPSAMPSKPIFTAAKRWWAIRGDGTMYLLSTFDIAELMAMCRSGGCLQRVDKAKHEAAVSESTLRRLHVGSDLNSCIVEEVLGIQSERPRGFSAWEPPFAGKPVSRLYAMDQRTALEGRPLGWVVDVFSMDNPTGNGWFVLKRIIHDKEEPTRPAK